METSLKKSIILVLYTGLIPVFHSCKKEIVPTLTTSEVTNITITTATSGGTITDEGSGTVIEKGVCWSTNNNPSIGDNKTSDGAGKGSYSSNINGLTGETKYWTRAYATNKIGTGYGNLVYFTTIPSIGFNPNLTYGTVSDIEGNNYKTIQIGTQTWMAENLNTGISIPSSVEPSDNRIIEKHCFNGSLLYGGYYQWDEMMNYSDSDDKEIGTTRGICPVGWHIPTKYEWQTLKLFLSDSQNNQNDLISGRLKEAGTKHWASPNDDATNESGFTALPAGFLTIENLWAEQTNEANFWSSTEGSFTSAYSISLYYFTVGGLGVDVDVNKTHGYSVRCIKDIQKKETKSIYLY